MAITALHGDTVHTVGTLPAKGTQAPNFTLTNKDLADVNLSSYKENFLVLNIFPSIDTGVCATSVRKFNEKADGMANTRVLCISADLPFAPARFCGAEGLDQVETLSCFRNPSFGQDYGCLITDSPLQGVLARCVVVLNAKREIIHTQLVPEISTEPDYAAVERVLQTNN